MTDETLVATLSEEAKAALAAGMLVKVGEWYRLAQQAGEIKTAEMDLRKELVAHYFPKGLKEGTNEADLPEGWVIKAKGTVNRKIDEPAKDAIAKELAEKYKVDLGDFIKYKPDLDLPVYRELIKLAQMSPEGSKERADRMAIVNLINQALIITDGSPGLEVVKPKKAKTETKARAKVME